MLYKHKCSPVLRCASWTSRNTLWRWKGSWTLNSKTWTHELKLPWRFTNTVSLSLSLYCFVNIALIPVRSIESKTALSQLDWRSWHDQELTAFGHNITNEYLWFRIHLGLGPSWWRKEWRERDCGRHNSGENNIISAFQIFVCSFSLIDNLEAYCPVCIQCNHRQNIQIFWKETPLYISWFFVTGIWSNGGLKE